MENITDFEFYLRFAKPLVLNLPEISDRVLAAAWVKKLAEDTNTKDKIRLDYLKLLLFVLQRKKLVPPFTQHPNTASAFQEFPEDQTLVDIAKTIVEKDLQERRELLKKKLQGGDNPPYISDFSADLLEYVAVQNIENFGAHGYYAVSKEPLNTWHRVDKQLLPKAAKSMLEVSVPPPTLLETHSSPDLKEKEKTPEEPPPCPETEEEAAPEETQQPAPTEETPEAAPTEPPPEEPPTPKREKTPKKKSTLGATPPSRPIGKVSPPVEDREPPTWGSNLLEAKFLEEDIGDIVQDAELDKLFGFDLEGTSPTAELLWESPPPRPPGPDSPQAPSPPSRLAPHQQYEDQFDADLAYTPMKMPRAPSPLRPESPIPHSPHYTSAPSLPYMTPPVPEREQPPPPPLAKKKKRGLPVPRPTRASMLLQKKKEKDLAPPPPPKKSSRSRLKAPKKKEVKKKEEYVFESPGEGVKAFEDEDEVENYVADFTALVGELKGQYQEHMTAYQQKYLNPVRGSSMGRSPMPESRTRLPALAKRSLPVRKIPRRHDARVPLEKSIHVSADARKILEGVIEGPAVTSGAIPRPESRLRYPKPVLGQSVRKEEAQVTESDEAEEPDMSEDSLEYAKTDVKGKDSRVADAYNDILEGVDAEEIAKMDAEIEEYERLEREAEQDVADFAEKYGLEVPETEDFDVDDPEMWDKMEREAQEDLEAYQEEIAAEEEEEEEDEEEPQRRAPSPQRRAPSPVYAPPPQAAQYQSPPRPPQRSPQQRSPSPQQRLPSPQQRSPSPQYRPPTSPPRTLDVIPQEETEEGEVAPRAATQVQQIEEEEEDDLWIKGEEFFADTDRAHAGKVRAEDMLGHDTSDAEEPPLEDDIIEETFEPGTPNSKIDDIAFMYKDYIQTTPAYFGVPVTTPFKTPTPRRQGQLVDVPEITSTIRKEYLRRAYEGNLGQSPQLSIQSPPKPEFQLPPSPPHTILEELEMPKSPSEAVYRYPPEWHRFDYTSPPDLVKQEDLKYTQPVDETQMTPPQKRWYLELEDMHQRIYGVRPRQKSPTVFDIPGDKMQYESPPLKLASPISPVVSPPIDVEQLKQEVVKGRLRPALSDLKRNVGPEGQRVQKSEWDRPPWYMSPVKESEAELPPGLTGEDLDRRMELEDYTPMSYQRRPFQLPYQNVRRIPKTSARKPGLETHEEQEESPIKYIPDPFDIPGGTIEESYFEEISPPFGDRSPGGVGAFDMPDMPKMGGESPPDYYTGQEPFEESPPIDVGALKTDIQDLSRSPQRNVRRRLFQTPQRLRTLGERVEMAKGEELEQWERIRAARGEWQRVPDTPEAEWPMLEPEPVEGLHITQLSPIASARVSKTPTGRLADSGSPKAVRKRVLLKNLKKRRLDFDAKGQEEPEDRQIVATDIEAHIVEHPSLEEVFEQDPAVQEAFRTYAKARGYLESPLAHPLERTPEQGIMQMEMPDTSQIPQFEPLSPMSRQETMDAIFKQARESEFRHPPGKASKGVYHKMHPKRGEIVTRRPKDHRTRSREFYKTRPWRALDEVAEIPLEERAAELHEVMEADVEAELRRREEEERERHYLLDEPVQEEGLLSPAEPKTTLYGYETPPELKLLPYGQRPLRDDLGKEMGVTAPGMKLFAKSPEEEEMDLFLRMEEMSKVGNVRHLVAEAPQREERAAAMDVQQRAAAQYAQLLTPPPTPRTPPRMPARGTGTFIDYLDGLTSSPHMRELEKERAMQVIYDQRMKEDEERAKREIIEKRKAEKERKRLEAKTKSELRSLQYQEKMKGKPKRGVVPKGAKVPAKKEPPKKEEDSRRPEAAPATKKGKYKNVKSRLMRGTEPPSKSTTSVKSSDKSLKSAKSDKSIQSAKSDKSLRSTRSDSSVAKKRRKGIEVKSKINTGLAEIKKRKKPQPQPEPPQMQVQYDVAALQDLGLTDDDLRNVNIDDRQVTYEAQEEAPMFLTGSPLRFRTMLEAHEYYDPGREYMKKGVKVKGKVVPVGKAQPVMSPVMEEEEPSTRPPPPEWRTGKEEYDEHIQQQMAVAEFRLKHGADVSPAQAGANVLDVVSPTDGPLFREEELAIMEVEGMGGTSPMAGQGAGFGWMSPTRYEGRWPWEE